MNIKEIIHNYRMRDMQDGRIRIDVKLSNDELDMIKAAKPDILDSASRYGCRMVGTLRRA